MMLRRAFLILFIGAAVYHVAGAFGLIDGTPAWRHLLFVVIDLFCAWGFHKRPFWFTWVFVLLVIQQFQSHGGKLLREWNASASIDWLSVGTLIMLVLALVDLVSTDVDGKERSSRR